MVVQRFTICDQHRLMLLLQRPGLTQVKKSMLNFMHHQGQPLHHACRSRHGLAFCSQGGTYGTCQSIATPGGRNPRGYFSIIQDSFGKGCDVSSLCVIASVGKRSIRVTTDHQRTQRNGLESDTQVSVLTCSTDDVIGISKVMDFGIRKCLLG